MPQLPSTRGSLLVRLRTDDADAWAEFVRVYGPAVYGYAVRRRLQPADAADLTQDVFRLVAGGIGRFVPRDDGGSFRAWLFTIVRREHQRLRRKAERRPEPLTDDIPAADEFDDWDAAVRTQLVAVALDEIKPLVAESTWRAFRLTAVEGLSGEQAAERLGLTRAAVYLARGRILARLRERLESFGNEDV